MPLFRVDDDYLTRLARGDFETTLHFETWFRQILPTVLLGRNQPDCPEDVVWDEVLANICTSIRVGNLTNGGLLSAFVYVTCIKVVVAHGASRKAHNSVPKILRMLSTLPEPDAVILRAVFFRAKTKGSWMTRRYWRVVFYRLKKICRLVKKVILTRE